MGSTSVVILISFRTKNPPLRQAANRPLAEIHPKKKGKTFVSYKIVVYICNK
jgi:hypothetical protein